MKMVKSLLLGSAAGLVAVSGGQAADLLVKAKPVEYVKVCSLYGAGFYYVPGTDTCVKFGMAIRVQAEYNAGGGGVLAGSATGSSGTFTRNATNDVNFRNRIYFSMDTRTQTDYGTLRSYFRMGISQTTPADTAAGNVFWDRAFIQYAGFTIGHTQSFFDIYTYGGAQTYLNVRTAGDTGPSGLTVWAYTAQFGNGVSATLAAEDPGGHNRMGVVALSGGPLTVPTGASAGGGIVAAGGGFGIVPITLQAPFGLGSVAPNTAYADQPAALSGLNNALANGFQMPDIIGNLRIDDSWGYAGVSGALHQVGGAYYTGGNAFSVINPVTGVAAVNPLTGTSNLTTNGRPGDELGWAIAAGALVNTPFLFGPNDRFGINAVYAQGATGYATNSSTWLIYRGGQSVGVGWATDGVYDCPGGIVAGAGCPTGTSIQLTTSWDINAAYEHLWTPQLRTTFYGGYAEVDYNSTAKALINSRLPTASVCNPGAAATGVTTGATITAITPLAGNSCNPSFSFYQIGARTQWNPHPDLDIGVDLLYTRLNTAYQGPAAYSASGAQPGCSSTGGCTIDGQNVWSVMGRWQRNFLP